MWATEDVVPSRERPIEWQRFDWRPKCGDPPKHDTRYLSSNNTPTNLLGHARAVKAYRVYIASIQLDKSFPPIWNC